MRLRHLHRWDLDYSEAAELQRRLAPGVREAPLRREPRTVCGLDVSCRRHGSCVYAGAVVLGLPRLEVVEVQAAVREAAFPYIPGLLSFREAPAVLEALGRLKKRPDLIVCDGQGRAHPRRLGLACHIGLWAAVPTIGVAKSRLVGEHRVPAARRGSSTRLLDPATGELLGRVVRTRDGVKPVYVSVGHRVTLDEAVRLTLALAPRYRLTEPIRAAHRFVGELRREAEGE